MDHSNRNFDEIITKDSFLIFENKTTPYVRPKKLRPRFGHIAALVLLLIIAWASPPLVKTAMSIMLIVGMVCVALVFLVHLPIKTLISDKKTFAVGREPKIRSKVQRGQHQNHSS